MPTFNASVQVTLLPTGASISPLIYGVNNEHDPNRLSRLGGTVNRLGGTPWSALNGPIRATNSGSDYYYHNYNSIGGIPNDPPGFHQKTTDVGGTTMLTVPLLDYVAKDTQSYAFSVRKYGTQASVLDGDAGDGIKPGGNGWKGPFVTGNDPSDAYTPNSPALVETWLRSLPGTVHLFGLDNEPMIWHRSHRAAHPEGARMQEVIAATKSYGARVRSVFPTAAILGPEEWNYEGCFFTGYDAKRAESLGYNAAAYPDRQANGGQDWIPVYVKAMKDHHTQTGQRLIDYLSLHFYPHNTSNQTLLEDKTDTPALRDLRLRSTRSLWDAGYASEDYIKDFGPNKFIRLIPRLKQWAAEFPGTKTALTEYSFGPDELLASALAQVEALGVFGQEGLDLACRWPSPNPNSPVGLAFRLYRNFDGAGKRFGSVRQRRSVTGAGPELLSVFAATDERRSGLTVILLNKSQTDSGNIQLSLTGAETTFQSTLFVQPPYTLDATAHRLESDGTASGARLLKLTDPSMIGSRPAPGRPASQWNLALTLPPFSATLVHIYPRARRIPGPQSPRPIPPLIG